jgi:hypothetical protein
LIVGKDHTGKSFTGAHQVYVRKPGEAKSWLANGDVSLKEKGSDWLDKKILEVKRERIRAVEIRHADGEVVVVDREKPDAKDFTLHDIPEGKDLTYPSAPTSVADALGYLNLEDVVPAESMDMKEDVSCTSRFSCFDGLTITVRTKEVGDKTYARFEASYEAPPETAGPSPASESKKDDAKDTSQASAPEAKDGAAKTEEKPKTKTAEEVQKEVTELNGRLSKWVYQIPSYNKSSFEKKKSELLKDRVSPPAGATKTETPPAVTPETAPNSSEEKPPQPPKPPSETNTPEGTKPPEESKPPGDAKPPQEDAKPPEPPKPPRGG